MKNGLGLALGSASLLVAAAEVQKRRSPGSAGSMARRVTMARIDKDEATFARKFGGLVSNEDGSAVEIDFDDHDALDAAIADRTLWTHLDGEGGTFMSPGFHRVNRIAYHRSIRPWTAADESTDYAWTN